MFSRIVSSHLALSTGEQRATRARVDNLSDEKEQASRAISTSSGTTAEVLAALDVQTFGNTIRLAFYPISPTSLNEAGSL